MKTILAFIGLISVVAVVGAFLYLLIQSTVESWRNIRWTYKYKHRFGIKPTAKCYCHDCKKWDRDTGKCSDPLNLRYMGEMWFCCFAEPKENGGDANG